jgi:hypothetical protein
MKNKSHWPLQSRRKKKKHYKFTGEMIFIQHNVYKKLANNNKN